MAVVRDLPEAKVPIEIITLLMNSSFCILQHHEFILYAAQILGKKRVKEFSKMDPNTLFSSAAPYCEGGDMSTCLVMFAVAAARFPNIPQVRTNAKVL